MNSPPQPPAEILRMAEAIGLMAARYGVDVVGSPVAWLTALAIARGYVGDPIGLRARLSWAFLDAMNAGERGAKRMAHLIRRQTKQAIAERQPGPAILRTAIEADAQNDTPLGRRAAMEIADQAAREAVGGRH